MSLDMTVGGYLRLAATEGVLDEGSASARQLDALLHATPNEGYADLAGATHFHGIAAYVHDALNRHPQVPEDTREHVRQLRDRAAFNHLRTLADLAYLERVLDGGVPWLIVKGPTLAEPVHGSAQRRSYGDLDAVVPARFLAAALEALESSGSTLTDRNWTLIAEEMKGEVHLQLPSGGRLDLHWHLFNDRARRKLFPVSIDALFERSRTVPVSGRPVPTLSFPDTVVYIAIHTMHSGGHRLIWLKDLERLLAHPDCDPAAVVERAREWRAELVLTSAIRRVELALGTPPHATAIRAAARRHLLWDLFATLVWRRHPAEREDGRGSLGRIVSRSIRPTQRQSFQELGRRTYRHLRGRHEHGGDESGRLSSDDPRSDRFASGGTSAKEGFLSRVAHPGS